jgi:hypothetical protein
MSTIFISYAREDFQYAEEIFNLLKEQGFEPWMDKKNLLPGQNWEVILEETLRKVDFILLVISKNSVAKRGFIQREFRRAVYYCEEKLDTDIYVIPVKIDSCEIPPSLKKFHWIEYYSEDFKNKIEQAINLQSSGKKENFQERNIKDEKDGISKKSIYSKFPKSIRIPFFSLLLIFFVVLGIKLFSEPASNINTQDELTEKEKIHSFIVDYFEKLSFPEEANNFFADQVSNFYLRTNLLKQDIVDIRKKNDEFIGVSHNIDKTSFQLFSENNGVKFWRFITNFVCYRRKLNKYERAKVLMEFGINKDFKITSIKEIKILNLRFEKEKPTVLN